MGFGFLCPIYITRDSKLIRNCGGLPETNQSVTMMSNKAQLLVVRKKK